MNPIDEYLKEIILNLKAPYIIKNLQIPWPCFRTSFQDWTLQFDSGLACDESWDGGINFESGSRKHSNCPQWEKYRGKKKMTVSEFYEKSANGAEFFVDNWAAFGYKNIKEIPEDCANGFEFSFFGFPEVKDDITFWLSSTDAHTPCHYDTYGCNIIVQVYGRKSWLLFPPDAKLTPIRIPYEESSVYCRENFFSPSDVSFFKDINENCFNYTLNPGDVLIVPPKWWHYVESVCPSLSVNAWVPIESDIESQIEECIVRILIKNFMGADTLIDCTDILNPNEVGLTDDQCDLYRILQFLLRQKTDEPGTTSKHQYGYLSETEVAALVETFREQIIQVPQLSKYEFNDLMQRHLKRFVPNVITDPLLNFQQVVKYQLINSVCNPNTITNIKNDFLSRMKRGVN